MKVLILSFIIGFSTMAKVKDFNALISEDTKAQKELHSKLKNQVYTQKELAERKELAREKRIQTNKSIVFYDEAQTEITAPSNDKFFKFKKETKQKTTNPRKNQHRVAKELKELGL